jgi:hypothetical protein
MAGPCLDVAFLQAWDVSDEVVAVIHVLNVDWQDDGTGDVVHDLQRGPTPVRDMLCMAEHCTGY